MVREDEEHERKLHDVHRVSKQAHVTGLAGPSKSRDIREFDLVLTSAVRGDDQLPRSGPAFFGDSSRTPGLHRIPPLAPHRRAFPCDSAPDGLKRV